MDGLEKNKLVSLVSNAFNILICLEKVGLCDKRSIFFEILQGKQKGCNKLFL